MRFSASALAVVSLLALNPSLHAQEQPPWVNELPHADNQNYLAVATAETQAQAMQAALAAIAEQVAVSIRSESLSLYAKQTTEQSTQTQTRFTLNVAGQSVPIQFNDISPEQSYRHADGSISVKVAVSKQAVSKFLQNQIAQYRSLRFPSHANASQQLLWSLRYKEPLKTANAYALALEQIDPTQSTNPFKNQLSLLTQAEQSLGLRIVASRNLNALVGVIQRHTPTHSEPNLWLQLEQKSQQRAQGSLYLHRQQLIASVTEPRSPFRQLHQQVIEVIGEGTTPDAAAADAQNQLKLKVEQPVSNWLFGTSSE